MWRCRWVGLGVEGVEFGDEGEFGGEGAGC